MVRSLGAIIEQDSARTRAAQRAQTAATSLQVEDFTPLAPQELRDAMGALFTPLTTVRETWGYEPTELVLVPHFFLNLLPLHVATWKGQPLIEHYPVSYLPSSALAGEIVKQRKPLEGEALLLGNPLKLLARLDGHLKEELQRASAITSTLQQALEQAGVSLSAQARLSAQEGGNAWRLVDALHNHDLLIQDAGGSLHVYSMVDLPYSQAEVMLAAASLQHKGIAPKAFVRESATTQRVDYHAPSSSVIHFASHSLLDGVDFLRSGIELSDRRLSVMDVSATLELKRAVLVYLSSCDSAQMVPGRTDELMALVRVFLYAGSPTVLASLWALDDEVGKRFADAITVCMNDNRGSRAGRADGQAGGAGMRTPWAAP